MIKDIDGQAIITCDVCETQVAVATVDDLPSDDWRIVYGIKQNDKAGTWNFQKAMDTCNRECYIEAYDVMREKLQEA